MILFDQVSKQFHSGGKVCQAVEELSLHIPEGITVGVIGESGAGKTTFLKLVCGLLRPDRGRVRLEGQDPASKIGTRRKTVGALFADHTFLEEGRSVMKNLQLFAASYGLQENVAAERCGRLLEQLGLQKAADTVVRELSLGYRRRVELAAVLMVPSKVLLLDEPCIGMDELAKTYFRKLLENCRKEGRTLLISSHSMEEIEAMSDRILLLHRGKMLFYGDKKEVYRQLAPYKQILVSGLKCLPDLQDIPFRSYEMSEDQLNLTYHTNRVTAAEILKLILKSGKVDEISMKAPGLGDIIGELEEKEREDEPFD